MLLQDLILKNAYFFQLNFSGSIKIFLACWKEPLLWAVQELQL